MEVRLAKSAGFCFGVKRAVDKVYEQIKTGKKNIELRLYDEKRRKIAVGDKIIFTNRGKPLSRGNCCYELLYLCSG